MAIDSDILPALNRALAELLRATPKTVEDHNAINNCIAALLRVVNLSGVAEVLATQPAAPAAAPTAPTAAAAPSAPPKMLPPSSPFFGLGLREAAKVCLARGREKEAKTAKEIWQILEAEGFQSAHSDPAKNIQWNLRRRSNEHGDVILVGGGKWGLRHWYTDAEIEEINKSVGGMGGRDRGEHSQLTSLGLKRARERGVRLGAKAHLDEEKKEKIKQMIRENIPVSEIAKMYEVTSNAIRRYFDRDAIRQLRAEGEAQRQSSSGQRTVN